MTGLAPDAEARIDEALRLYRMGLPLPTQARYRSACRHFVRITGRSAGWTETDVRRYLAESLSAGRARSTLAWSLAGPIGALFAAEGRTLPVGRRALPPIDHGRVGPPVYRLDEITRLIATAQDAATDPALRAWVCAATLWGFRRSEIGRLDLDWEAGVVRVTTSKTGARREHQIPYESFPALQAWSPGSDRDLEARWIPFRRRAGLPRQRGEGWHAIRRGVATALSIAGVRRETIIAWMAWSQSSATVDRYVRPRPAELDAEVLPLHPLIPLWRGTAPAP